MTDTTEQIVNQLRRVADCCEAGLSETYDAEWMRKAADLLASQAAPLPVAELEAMRKDAERYRWLRTWTVGVRNSQRQSFSLPDLHPAGNIMKGSVAQHFDAAIDAQIAREVPYTAQVNIDIDSHKEAP